MAEMTLSAKMKKLNADRKQLRETLKGMIAAASSLPSAVNDLTGIRDSLGTAWWADWQKAAKLIQSGDKIRGELGYDALFAKFSVAEAACRRFADTQNVSRSKDMLDDLQTRVDTRRAQDRQVTMDELLGSAQDLSDEVRRPAASPSARPVNTWRPPVPPVAVPATLNPELAAILNFYSPEELLAALKGGLDAGRAARGGTKQPGPIRRWVDEHRVILTNKPADQAAPTERK